MCARFLENETNWRIVQILLAIGGIIVASCFAYQQNKINESLLNLEKSAHVPILKVAVQSVHTRLLPYSPDDSSIWLVSTEFKLSNGGSVPLRVLEYNTSAPAKEGVYIERFKQPATSTELDILPIGVTKTYYGTALYSDKPKADQPVYSGKPNPDRVGSYKLEIQFKEYPDGDTQCLEIQYVDPSVFGSWSSFYEKEKACGS